jgi:hypothetical protein
VAQAEGLIEGHEAGAVIADKAFDSDALAHLPQLGQNFTDFQVLFRRNSLSIGPTSSQTPM